MSGLLRILHLSSPALPIGAFHFSQGLEQAVEAGWIHDEATARDWISGLAEGAALVKVLREIAPELPSVSVQTYAAAFARASVHWEVSETDTLLGYVWAWAENQVLAAVKLVPLGQSSGQRILHALIPKLERLIAQARAVPDNAIGYCGAMQFVASARHESQYTRLFRS